jgi:beta-xylosidase
VKQAYKMLAAVLLAASVAACQGVESAGGRPGVYHNPIVAGDWSDPGVIRVGEDYYACRSTFGWQPGIPIIRSRDLVHWEYIGQAFASHPKLNPGDTRTGIWGLEMHHNPHTRQFQVYAPTRDGEVFVYSSDRPEGPYTEMSLGKNLGIDPGVFTDEDGSTYFLSNRAVIHRLSRDGLRIEGQVAALDKSRYRFFEGPDIFRRGEFYYLLFSDGGTLPREPSTISTLRAKALTGPWEEDPAGPTMFSTGNGAMFEGPAHGTLLQTQEGEWYLTYHAHETAYYSLGRQMCMEPVEWTAEGWWRPAGGKVPSTTARAPRLPLVELKLAQSDDFSGSKLGLQWFFTCAPDFSGKAWSLTEKPGVLRVRTQPGDLGALSALPGIFQQRVIDKRFAFQTMLTFDARAGREAAGLHMYHDPLMNFWIASTVREGERRIEVGKHTLGVRTDLASVPNTAGERVHLRIEVADEEARCAFSSDGKVWQPAGPAIYFGASGHHLRENRRGDPDLGWVGRYKDPTATPEQINGAPENQRQANRGGGVWTGTTFGVFAVQDGAAGVNAADFAGFEVSGR